MTITRMLFHRDYPALRWWSQRPLALGLVVAAVLLIAQALTERPSRDLSPAELASLREFAAQTGEPEVVRRLHAAERDGAVSLREAEEVIEVAKAHGPGYGLATDLRN
ncbi:hypothetical protein [Xanthomonas euvesicatoria]|uniref:hypothetical protein n=2 Tax=Xanthomonas euvesicatoria TaxID=456327 RepID=UPI00111273B6|nr:hypothetical protein [Xanthomonas euvesicatoria]MCC8799125.1 hypothetical protein [Xanthomonas euvesicatoria pv. euvesicatoria]MCC8807730.1 hypothetical protein [Xanthomonas euvesicatoria pv. euvesicatoria]